MSATSPNGRVRACSARRRSSCWQVPIFDITDPDVEISHSGDAEPLAGVHSDFTDPRGLNVDGGPASCWACSMLVRCRALSAVH
jgi:hypothetical protein